MTEALIIDAGHFLRRVGETTERKSDRRFAAVLLTWQFRHKWEAAREAGDYDLLDQLDRDWRMLECL